MNYEEFYQEAQILEKGLSDKLTSTQKSLKNITRDSEKGDLRSLNKELSQIRSLLGEFDALAAQLQELAGSFDAKEYFENGDFAKQITEYCEQYSVDIKGNFPTYEIFPYKLKIDADNQDLYINKKKLHCVRPLRFVKDIKASREKYIKSSFNANAFLNELMEAYDLAAIIKGRKNDNTLAEYDLFLKDLYEYMAPMQRMRKEYDLQNFAYDLSRLYSSDIEFARDGRKYEFGTSKAANKLIRILDSNGHEQFIGTIRFYKV